ncbi:hypothetical protein F0562_003873 [Nyssa sinensis]|uniref:TF-B3 domain-containing protein n=1 Tax=Nyssa sinensis TaxID=561372 RepID=A0A5J5BVX2_9ASTE|nr:hypothetical protein F0562_003873 [Nyssa sinensis]
MGRSPKRYSSFFKVLIGDFADKLEVNSPIRGNSGDAPTISEQANENPLMGIRLTARGRKSKAPLHLVKMENDESQGMDEAAGSVKAIQPSFVTSLKKYNRTYMIVPQDFATATGMRRKKSMVLRNLEGKEWPVVVREWKWKNYRSVVLRDGWSEFRRANKLGDGNTCLFRFVESAGNVIQVQRGRKLTRNT